MDQRKKRIGAILLATGFSLLLTGCNQQDIINAGYNTLLGMGMAFALLILISLVISLFPLIGKISEGKKSKKEIKEEMRLKAMDKTISHIEKQESAQAEKEKTAVSVKALSGKGNAEEEVAAIAAAIAASEEEGPELIAVISAAIAAFEADTGTESRQVVYGSPRRRQIPVPQGYKGFYVRSIRKIGTSQWKNS